MATVCHTIYSRYDSQGYECLEHETKIPDESNLTDAWQSNVLSRQTLPPLFVRATQSSDEWSASEHCRREHAPSKPPLGPNLAGWYRSLTNRTDSKPEPRVHRSVQGVSSSQEDSNESTGSQRDWFIAKALQSAPPVTPLPIPSLADIVARDPPPLPNEEKYHPPVWLQLGPSNKGFEMLRRSGWSEGEALGPDVARRQSSNFWLQTSRGKRGSGPLKREYPEIMLSTEDDVRGVPSIDIIDLTLSESDSGDDEDSQSSANTYTKQPHAFSTSTVQETSNVEGHLQTSAYGRTALLTPIATVLKSDRLGIGLKAKTVGPYKASQKRVTHSAAALAAHIKATESLRKSKKSLGRGRRGFSKAQKHEELERKNMLFYLNS